MPWDAILDWMRTQWFVKPEQAVALHFAGIDPSELAWSYEDGDQMTLGHRLGMRVLTLEEVIVEVKDRRTRN